MNDKVAIITCYPECFAMAPVCGLQEELTITLDNVCIVKS